MEEDRNDAAERKPPAQLVESAPPGGLPGGGVASAPHVAFSCGSGVGATAAISAGPMLDRYCIRSCRCHRSSADAQLLSVSIGRRACTASPMTGHGAIARRATGWQSSGWTLRPAAGR